MRRLSPLPNGLPVPFSVADAREAGVGYGRTRSRDLAAPFHGIRVSSSDEPAVYPEARVTALARSYAPRLRPGQFFGEATALALHGLPLPVSRFHERDVHVCTAPPRTAPRARGVRGHQFLPSQLVTIAKLPVCGALDAWSHCADAMSVHDLVVVGDALVRRRQPMSTVDELANHVAARAGHRGARRLRSALELIRPGTDSAGESLLRLLIVGAGLPEPVVNYPIRDSSGRFLALGDLVYPEARVVIEYEGAHHFASEAQIVHDLERHARLFDAGWRIIRVHKSHLASPGPLIARILAALGP